MTRSSWPIPKFETPIDRARPACLQFRQRLPGFVIPILVGKRVVDQVQVDVAAAEPLKAALEHAQRRITPVLRELRRDVSIVRYAVSFGLVGRGPRHSAED